MVIPVLGQDTQFITGVCTSDADCASGCCSFLRGVCAGATVAGEEQVMEEVGLIMLRRTRMQLKLSPVFSKVYEYYPILLAERRGSFVPGWRFHDVYFGSTIVPMMENT